MLHRAILGSLERFIGILIEHHAGFLPLLAPTQLVVMNITDSQTDYVVDVANPAAPRWLPCCGGLEKRKLPIKSGRTGMQRLPYQLIVGDKEKAAGMVAVADPSR